MVTDYRDGAGGAPSRKACSASGSAGRLDLTLCGAYGAAAALQGDEGLLQVTKRRAAFVEVVALPLARRGQPPRRRAVVEGHVEQATDLRDLRATGELDEALDATVEVAVHE